MTNRSFRVTQAHWHPTVTCMAENEGLVQLFEPLWGDCPFALPKLVVT